MALGCCAGLFQNQSFELSVAHVLEISASKHSAAINVKQDSMDFYVEETSGKGKLCGKAFHDWIEFEIDLRDEYCLVFRFFFYAILPFGVFRGRGFRRSRRDVPKLISCNDGARCPFPESGSLRSPPISLKTLENWISKFGRGSHISVLLLIQRIPSERRKVESRTFRYCIWLK